MRVETVAENVCSMASDFYRLRNRSLLDLLRSPGYLEHHSEVTEDALLACLRRDPTLTLHWITQSEDKRTSSGYYLLAPGLPPHRSDKWIVGYYPRGKVVEFSDEASACAHYVKAEAEQLRQQIQGDGHFDGEVLPFTMEAIENRKRTFPVMAIVVVSAAIIAVVLWVAMR